MHTIQKILVVSSLSLLLPFVASAQSISEIRAMSPEDRRAYMESMSADERSAKRQQWRSEFDALPEEERQAIREQRAAARDRHRARNDERRARWDSMSEEEKAAARARRGERGGHHGKQHHKDRPDTDQPED